MKRLIILLAFLPLLVQGQVKVSEMTSAVAVNDADYFLLVQSGSSKKVAYSVFKHNAADVATQLNDSLVNYIQIVDSINGYYTAFAINDSLDNYIAIRDSTTNYLTLLAINDSIAVIRSDISDSLSGYAVTAYGNSGDIPYTNATGDGFLYEPGTSSFKFTGNRLELEADSGLQNIPIGYNSGNALETGSVGNVVIGYLSGLGLSTEDYNTYIGNRAGRIATTSSGVCIGYGAGEEATGSNIIAIGEDAGFYSTGSDVIAIGKTAGEYASGAASIYIGLQAGKASSNSGSYNVYIGESTGYDNTTGSNNVSLGRESMSNNTTGSNNIVLGTNAAYTGTDYDKSIIIGEGAGYSSDLNNTVSIGYQSGYSGAGSGHVFLGYQAGYNETSTNKLYIENSSSATPLIYGDFANDTVKINGNFEVTGHVHMIEARIGAYIDEDSTLTTTITVPDTYVFMGVGANNKFTNIFTNDFGFTGDTLQYTGSDTHYFHLEYGGTVSCNTVNETVSVTIYINDVEQKQLTTSTFCTTAAQNYPIAGCSNIVSIAPNEKIKIMITSNSATTITTERFPISLHKIN